MKKVFGIAALLFMGIVGLFILMGKLYDEPTPQPKEPLSWEQLYPDSPRFNDSALINWKPMPRIIPGTKPKKRGKRKSSEEIREEIIEELQDDYDYYHD